MRKLLIVGLGNPGSQHARNHHNIGFMILDELASKLGVTFTQSLRSRIAILPDLILCKPMTFMNCSGEAVQALLNYYKLQDFLVVHDDLDIALGELRLKIGGGSGGHNGLKSIDACCGNEYMRIRCGIGRPPQGVDVSAYVLSDFLESPQELIQSSLEVIAFLIEKRDFIATKNYFLSKKALGKQKISKQA